MQASHSALIRRLALLSLAGQLVWVAVVVVAGAIEPGYSATRDAISFLGAATAERPWVFETGVAIWGLAFIAVAVALSLDAPRTWRGQLGPALIALTGLAQILVGFPFPADCRDTIDAGCEARELAGRVSWQHQAHSWAYIIGGDALLLSVFAMAWRFRGDPRWGRADLLTLGSALLGVPISATLFFFAESGMDGSYGLVQRLALAAGAIWVAALALGLLAIHGRSGDPVVRLVERLRRLPGGELLVRPGSGSTAGATSR
jgi:hypothetical protein